MNKELKEIIGMLLELPDPEYQEVKKFDFKIKKLTDLFNEVFEIVDEKRAMYKGAE